MVLSCGYKKLIFHHYHPHHCIRIFTIISAASKSIELVLRLHINVATHLIYQATAVPLNLLPITL